LQDYQQLFVQAMGRAGLAASSTLHSLPC